MTGAPFPSLPLPRAGKCALRLFLPTDDACLIALSANTGAVCPGFGGDDGTVDMWRNMPNVTADSISIDDSAA